MRRILKGALAVATAAALAFSCFGCSAASKSPLDPKNPTSITIWNYYNGDQLEAFDQLVAEFNASEGADKGIIVTSVSQGSVNNLASSLLDAANGKVGAQDMPTMASVYAETALVLDQKGLLANLDEYFTKDELAAYVPDFIEEGRMTEDGDLLLFPASKSTECFAVNTTDWAPFQAATGITVDSITSFEALTSAAKAYYDYTDTLTPDVADDGKALYGRDSIANYLYVGSKQLGHQMFTVSKDGVSVDLDRATFKTMWDNYYIPYINGYFTAVAKYRSEDVKTGAVLAMTGSTSGASYLPTRVTDASDTTHDIAISIDKPLNFEGGSQVAVQQGADYCVVKSTEAQQYAAVEFLKWFTESDRNLEFSGKSGYSPVTVKANTADAINGAFADDSSVKAITLDTLLTSADVYTNEETYTTKPFDNSARVRDVLGNALQDTCTADRAAVVAAMAAGTSRQDAVASYSTDAYFDAWFDNLKAQVDAALKASN